MKMTENSDFAKRKVGNGDYIDSGNGFDGFFTPGPTDCVIPGMPKTQNHAQYALTTKQKKPGEPPRTTGWSG